jgi:hypothetical protein
MLKTSCFVVLALLLVAGIESSAYAQVGSYSELGSTHVNGQQDHDTIHVKNGGSFRALQIRVGGSAVHFNRIIVRYWNGQLEQISVRDVIPAGGSSRDINLPGTRRVISTIGFWYEKASWGIRPKVTVFGLR